MQKAINAIGAFDIKETKKSSSHRRHLEKSCPTSSGVPKDLLVLIFCQEEKQPALKLI